MKLTEIIILSLFLVWFVSLYYFYTLPFNPYIVNYEDLVEVKENKHEAYFVYPTEVQNPEIERTYFTDRNGDEEPRVFRIEEYNPFSFRMYVLMHNSEPEDSVGGFKYSTVCKKEYERKLYNEAIGEPNGDNPPILFNCPGEIEVDSSSLGSVWTRDWDMYQDLYSKNYYHISPILERKIDNNNYDLIIYNETQGKNALVIGDEKTSLYKNPIEKFKIYLKVINEYTELNIKSLFSPLYLSMIGVVVPLLLLIGYGIFRTVNLIVRKNLNLIYKYY